MPIVLDYFLISASPYAYLGHNAFHELAARHGAQIRYRPISIAKVWEQSGSLPLAKRSAVRQRYRRIELQRIADIRGLPVNLEPKFFPVDPTLSDRTVIALVESGANPTGYLWRVHRGLWVEDANIADPEQLAAYLEAEGHDADEVLTAAQSAASAEILDANTQAAIAVDAIGAPVYVLNGEAFWGQDRLDYLAHALETGRAPFRS